MIFPHPFWRISGIMVRARKKGARKLISIVFSQLSSVIFSTGSRRLIPAAFTRMSGVPKGWDTRSNNLVKYSVSFNSAQKAAQTAVGRNGEHCDLEGITVFLASQASDYITGQTIYVDGGFTAK